MARGIMYRVVLVVGLVAVAALLGLLALGFLVGAAYLVLDRWMAAPLAALLTSVISVVVAGLVLWIAGRSVRIRGRAEDSPPMLLVRSYPFQSTAMAFAVGFLAARSREATSFIGQRLFSTLSTLATLTKGQ